MNENRSGLYILISGFALFVTAHTMQLSVASLIGAQLAPDKSLATLPLFTVMLGTALATVPASMFMKYVTRRIGFMCGSVLAILGAGTAIYAVRVESFWLFIVGTGLIGMFNAFCQLYRFAGAELVAPERKGRAISLVLAGGILGGLLGPNLEALSRGWFEVSFMGPYFVIVCIGTLNILLMSFLDMGKPPTQLEGEPQRSLGEIATQPVFIVAALSAMVAFGVMASFMAGSPMIIQKFHHSHHQATSAISVHTMLMYTPALFVAALIARFGVLSIIGSGIVFQIAGFIVLYAGKSYTHFMAFMILLALGWSFMFIGGTALATRSYTPVERPKTQALHDCMLFTWVALCALSSGWMDHNFGTNALPVVAISLLLLTAVIILLFRKKVSAATS
jgi:predicted MFS family arabinose efflux permease